MKRTRTVLSALLMAGVFFVSFAGIAVDPDYLMKNFPRDWEGTFQWHGDKVFQTLLVTIDTMRLDADGNVIALGSGRYASKNGFTDITVKWVIDPRTMTVEIFEGNAVGSPVFDVDGSHVGYIASGMDKVYATWTTKSTGRQGNLYLRKKQ